MLYKLDRIDLRILCELQKNGNITNIDLSKKVGISPPPCLRRVKNLETEKIILSTHAKINASLMGFTVAIFCEVGLENQNEIDLRSFEEQTKKWPLVRECYLITGGFDFLLKVVARDFDEYQNFMSNELASHPKVTHIKTKMVIRNGKSEFGLPLEVLAT